MANLEKIIEDLDALTSLEKTNLVGMLEEKWGVEAPKEQEMPDWLKDRLNPQEPEQDSFKVVLKGTTKRIDTIKKVRELLGLQLKEARDFIENFPKTVKEDLSKEEADELKKVLEEAGGEVEIQ